MIYRVLIQPSAVRELKKLEPRARQRIASVIDALAEEPRPPGARKLVGRKDDYRLRVGDFRVLYRIRNRELVVLVVKVGHRRDIYR